MKKFFHSILVILGFAAFESPKPATLEDVQDHLDDAADFKDLHVESLQCAKDAVLDHNANAQQTIQSLTQTIGQVQGQIAKGSAHLASIDAQLAAAGV